MTRITLTALSSVFLWKLEYYEGIMFLSTNRVGDFDDAIQSRIHHAVRYDPLGIHTRRALWDSFLIPAITARGAAVYSGDKLDDLARHDLNGRQVGFCFTTPPEVEFLC